MHAIPINLVKGRQELTNIQLSEVKGNCPYISTLMEHSIPLVSTHLLLSVLTFCNVEFHNHHLNMSTDILKFLKFVSPGSPTSHLSKSMPDLVLGDQILSLVIFFR